MPSFTSISKALPMVRLEVSEPSVRRWLSSCRPAKAKPACPVRLRSLAKRRVVPSSVWREPAVMVKSAPSCSSPFSISTSAPFRLPPFSKIKNPPEDVRLPLSKVATDFKVKSALLSSRASSPDKVRGCSTSKSEMLDPKVRRLPFRSRLVRATARVVTHVRLSRKYSSGEVSSKVPPACSKRSSKVRVLLSKLNTPEPERCDSP